MFLIHSQLYCVNCIMFMSMEWSESEIKYYLTISNFSIYLNFVHCDVGAI